MSAHDADEHEIVSVYEVVALLAKPLPTTARWPIVFPAFDEPHQIAHHPDKQKAVGQF